jgi:predicted kinase
MLIVFGGLPGSGKTTLARQVAADRGAAYLRIDVIEQALRGSGTLAGDVGPAGYLAAYALAESNLVLGGTVVADCVNPLAVTREAWRAVAAAAAKPILEIEIVCSDAAEHRRRVETREADIPGHRQPDWRAVVERDYEPWDRPRLVLDTAGISEAEAITVLRTRVAAWRP